MKWSKRHRSLLLACAKCQRKLRKEDDSNALGRLKKRLKHEKDAQSSPLRLTVIETGCLRVCPKGGVVVATAGQLNRGRCSILRSPKDLAELMNPTDGTDKDIDAHRDR